MFWQQSCFEVINPNDASRPKLILTEWNPAQATPFRTAVDKVGFLSRFS
jgi:hypothetical protein